MLNSSDHAVSLERKEVGEMMAAAALEGEYVVFVRRDRSALQQARLRTWFLAEMV